MSLFAGGAAARTPASVVSGPPFLHAGGFGFGDVLVVGLVLQLPAEVLDGFVQSLLQGNLFDTNTHTQPPLLNR